MRALRTARGLTQKDLAGDEFTKAFISQIEIGQSNLSMRAAQVIASRLGVAIGDLFGQTSPADQSAENQLLEAERELASGSADEALRMATRIVARPALRGRLLRLRGRALYALERSREALPLFDEALLQFRGNGQADQAARTLYDIALAHARLDQIEEAILSALECERALKSGDLVDRTLELQLRSVLAAAYVRRGDLAAADLQIERALELSKDVSSRDARATLYASLARTEQERGRLAQATALWRKSLEEVESLGLDQAVAETWNNLALVYRDQGKARDARAALSRAAEIAAATGYRRIEPWLDLTRAKLALDEGKTADAEHMAMTISQSPVASARAKSEAQLVLASVLRGKGGSAAKRVRTIYEDALKTAASQPVGVRVRILRAYADALEEQGDARASLGRMREALDLVRPSKS